MTNEVLNKWTDFKLLIETMEDDIQKNAAGNKAAGTRARKGLRALKTSASELIKLTLGKE